MNYRGYGAIEMAAGGADIDGTFVARPPDVPPEWVVHEVEDKGPFATFEDSVEAADGVMDALAANFLHPISSQTTENPDGTFGYIVHYWGPPSEEKPVGKGLAIAIIGLAAGAVGIGLVTAGLHAKKRKKR